MSLRAELLRLGTRCLLKGRPGADASLAERRRRATLVARLVPRPPSEIQRVAVEAGGVAAAGPARARESPGGGGGGGGGGRGGAPPPPPPPPPPYPLSAWWRLCDRLAIALPPLYLAPGGVRRRPSARGRLPAGTRAPVSGRAR